MKPMITAFKASPDRGRGLARDMPVRWALEEVGQGYDVRLRTFEELKSAEHKAIQPFGQIPTYEEGGLALFESGSIILHIAEQHEGLLPKAVDARARAITWMFAAKATMEPPIIEREQAMLVERDKPWYDARLPMLEERIRTRLADLSTRLGEAEWLDGDFSAGDLMMIMVLRRPAGESLLPAYPNLAAYVRRGEARPAYQRAFAAQYEVFEAAQASG